MRVAMMIAVALVAAACNGTDPDSPSGACAQDEQSALALYGPPLGVSTTATSRRIRGPARWGRLPPPVVVHPGVHLVI